MLDTLSNVYEQFLDANPHVPKLSADEALLALGDYPQEKRWLIAFVALWEESSRFEFADDDSRSLGPRA